jgi:hypothetical protein
LPAGITLILGQDGRERKIEKFHGTGKFFWPRNSRFRTLVLIDELKLKIE